MVKPMDKGALESHAAVMGEVWTGRDGEVAFHAKEPDAAAVLDTVTLNDDFVEVFLREPVAGETAIGFVFHSQGKVTSKLRVTFSPELLSNLTTMLQQYQMDRSKRAEEKK